MAKYQSQFIPTDFNTLGNVLNMYRQDMAQRDAEYDQSYAASLDAISQLGQLPSFDLEGRDERLQALSTALEEAVQKRGGDYGAASKDIARIIAKERANPWYGLNARQLQQAELLEKSLANNQNLKVLQDPRRMSIDPSMGMEDISYSTIDPANVQKSIDDLYVDIKTRIREGDLQGLPQGLYRMMTTRGLTQAEVIDMANDPEVQQAILNRNPQLIPYMDNPETSGWVNNLITQGLQKLYQGESVDIGKTGSGSRSSSGGTRTSDVSTTFDITPEVKTRIDNKVDRQVKDVSIIFDSKGNAVEPEKKTVSVPARGSITGGGAYDATVGSKEGQQWNVFTEYKDKYSALYNQYKKSGKSDKDFFREVTLIEKDKGYIDETEERLNNIDFSENAINLTSNVDEMFLNKHGRKRSWGDYADDFKDKYGLKAGQIPTSIRPDGKIIMKNPKGDEYQLNPSNLSLNLKEATDIMGKIYNDMYNYTATPEEIRVMNNKKIPMGYGKTISIHINENNITNRSVRLTDEQTGTYQDIPYRVFFKKMTGIIDSEITDSLRKPKVANE